MSFATPSRHLLVDPRQRQVSVLPGRGARLLAWLWQGALDARLVDGARPDHGDRLAARAWQVTRPRARRRLSRALEAVLRDAGNPCGRGTAAVPVHREQVEAAGDEIARVVERLQDPRPVRARGMVLLRRLLVDGNGPLYASGAGDELWQALRRAAIALG